MDSKNQNQDNNKDQNPKELTPDDFMEIIYLIQDAIYDATRKENNKS
jgi:hypothetical protein